GGFAEGVVDLPNFSSGLYTTTATGLRSGGVIATAQAAPYTFTQPGWLGNTLGVDNSVPAPYWTPIVSDLTKGLDLSVINRTYRFGGGFGLPTQISSLGQNLLAKPMLLEVVQNGGVLPITGQSLQLVSTTPSTAGWQGKATAGSQVQVAVTGQID